MTPSTRQWLYASRISWSRLATTSMLHSGEMDTINLANLNVYHHQVRVLCDFLNNVLMAISAQGMPSTEKSESGHRNFVSQFFREWVGISILK